MKFLFVLALLAGSICGHAMSIDTVPPKPLLMSVAFGEFKFAKFAIYDSTASPILDYKATEKDTVLVRWFMDQTPCPTCKGKKMLVRVYQLFGPGYGIQVFAAPEDNLDPAWDEMWNTTFGPLYMNLDEKGRPTSILFRQQNKFTTKWTLPILAP